MQTLPAALMFALMGALSVLLGAACTPEDPGSEGEAPGLGGSGTGLGTPQTDGGGNTGGTGNNPPTTPGNIPYALEPLPPGTQAPWPSGEVVHGALFAVNHVIDGDTVFLSTNASGSTYERVRLLGLDAPECDKHTATPGKMECNPSSQNLAGDAEPYGVQSGQELRSLLQGAREIRVACEMVGGRCKKDRYGRHLAWLVIDSTTDASEHMLRAGLAVTSTIEPLANIATYCRAEDEAIAARRGLWSPGYDEALNGFNSDKLHYYAERASVCRRALSP